MELFNVYIKGSHKVIIYDNLNDSVVKGSDNSYVFSLATACVVLGQLGFTHDDNLITTSELKQALSRCETMRFIDSDNLDSGFSRYKSLLPIFNLYDSSLNELEQLIGKDKSKPESFTLSELDVELPRIEAKAQKKLLRQHNDTTIELSVGNVCEWVDDITDEVSEVVIITKHNENYIVATNDLFVETNSLTFKNEGNVTQTLELLLKYSKETNLKLIVAGEVR